MTVNRRWIIAPLFVLLAAAQPGDGPAAADTPEAKLAAARALFERADYAQAEPLFRKVAGDRNAAAAVLQEARFLQGECLRLQGSYPGAADAYTRLLTEHPSTSYRAQAAQQMFDIANFWLDDTRAEMREDAERRGGKRWVVWPRWFHWDRARPVFEQEGRALRLLDQVFYSDAKGPLADQALFMAGTVKVYREDYGEADRYLSTLFNFYPHSPHAPQAILYTIYCRSQALDDSPAARPRSLAGLQELVQRALKTYPELAATHKDFFDQELEWMGRQEKSPRRDKPPVP
jgi:TolA-binding protein